MEKKRKLTDIVTTAGVGITTTVGGIELIKIAEDIGDRIAPHIEKYVGLIGSGVVEYGLPVVVVLGMFYFISTATKATDNYLLERQRE
ncbi:hypothetical protein J4223_03285 [Candidatus Woesearchaeota archaeon]|nr:hypothetical protein [Candidatus Woesearchaeota archaeon]